MLDELESAEYVVTRNSKRIMEGMLNEICADGQIFKNFEQKIEPLCEISRSLLDASNLAANLADRAKEDSVDVARALLIDLPTHPPNPTGP